VEACAISVHSIEVFDYRRGLCKAAKAIWTAILKALANKLFIFPSVNLKLPLLRDGSTEVVEEHTD
jgi:hypothetical protein